jgi:3-oxoacyl-[acyl-carrier-protein] synthase-1
MRDVYVVSDNIFSPIGGTSAENFSRASQDITGIRKHENSSLSPEPFYASLFGKDWLPRPGYSTFESLLIDSIEDARRGAGPAQSADTQLIIASTKGNISMLERAPQATGGDEQYFLHGSAAKVAGYFNLSRPPIVVSHACISGMLGIITAMRLLQSGGTRQVIVAGADQISKFILSGFQSFQAISPEPCRPFDLDRKGITLGEGAATLVLAVDRNRDDQSPITIQGGAVSNDANHISGPSRTGEELTQAIGSALRQARMRTADIDLVSAHGTATLYNDEMESLAINRAGLQSVPLNSLKGYYGHTLGAAGLIESVMSIQSLRKNLVLPSRGFRQPGTTKAVNVCTRLLETPLRSCLKTASGFGGCNAALIMGKV